MIKIVKKNNTGLRGFVEIPSDKSISHRAVILNSLAFGESVIRNFSLGKDCLTSVNILKSLGVDIDFIDDKILKIKSKGSFQKPQNFLDAENSGTTMRLMSGILAGQNFDSVLIGDESLSKRPMKRILEPLKIMGAKIEANNNHAPLKIYGKKLNGIEYISPIPSAQVKSCVLLAGLSACGKTTYIEPELSRNHTEIMLEYLGANILVNGVKTEILPSELESRDIEIVGDISSASFFIVAGLIVPNSDITLKNVGINPTRAGIIDVIKKMGGDIEIFEERVLAGEKVANIRVRYTENLKGCTICGADIPRLIDELPIIAVLATQADGKTLVKNAEDLRNKESDRISCLKTGLKKLGAQIEETTDGFFVVGKTQLNGDCELESFNDHRLAMSFYIAGLICKKEILIKGFDWVKISFPEFEKLIVELV